MSNILYDIPTRGRKSCWSLNVWKSRAALNLKGIEYTTHWVEYPEIEPTLSAVGIPPREGQDKSRHGASYTVPAVRLDGEYIMDSMAIAKALEAAHPTPSLHLDNPIVPTVQALLYKVFRPLVPELIPLYPQNVLREESLEYWVRTRTATFGKPLEQVRADDGGQKCYDAALEPLKEMAELLKKAGGPFFLGKEASYADIAWCGLVQFGRCASEDAFQWLVGVDDVFLKHYEACAPFMKRDD